MDYTFILFVIVIICSIVGRGAYQKGNLVLAKRLAWVTFCSTSLLATAYAAYTLLILAVGAIGGSLLMTSFMAVLWGYFAWREYQYLQMIRSL